MKLLPVEDAAGRQFFYYKLGDIYSFQDRDGSVHLMQIVEMHLSGDTQYYICHTDDNREYKLTGNRLFFLIHNEGYKLEKEGEAVEFPLTKDDVQKYTSYRDALEKSRLFAIKKKLKETNYKELEEEMNGLATKYFNGVINVEEWNKEIDRISGLMDEELEKIGLTQNDLKPMKVCDYCKGVGIIGGAAGVQICDCMLQNADKVKAIANDMRKKGRT